MKIRVLTFDGADELDFAGPYEVLRRAAAMVPDLDVALVTVEPQPGITAAFGMRIRPDGVLDSTPDLIVVPGGGWANRASRGIRAEIQRGHLPQVIAALHRQGTVIAGVCTGAMALAAAGILEGRPATTHHAALEDLRKAGAHIVNERVVDNGDVLTCGGVTAGLDLALHLVERYWGADLAKVIARGMEYRNSLLAAGGFG